jgi:hypothetical protein
VDAGAGAGDGIFLDVAQWKNLMPYLARIHDESRIQSAVHSGDILVLKFAKIGRADDVKRNLMHRHELGYQQTVMVIVMLEPFAEVSLLDDTGRFA